MKKIILAVCIVFMGAYATQAQVRVGGTIGYGTQAEAIGLGVIGDYMIKDNIGIAANFAYYFTERNEFAKTSFWEFNANVNYYFTETGSLEMYGIGGLNYSRSTVSIQGLGFDFGGSVGEIGLNLGIGSNFDIGKNFFPFAEMKYVVSKFDQLVIQAGVKFEL
ncbi:MAG: outer membrane beta-barrel protein [Cyclobacteriaceae bacterium]